MAAENKYRLRNKNAVHLHFWSNVPPALAFPTVMTNGNDNRWEKACLQLLFEQAIKKGIIKSSHVRGDILSFMTNACARKCELAENFQYEQKFTLIQR